MQPPFLTLLNEEFHMKATQFCVTESQLWNASHILVYMYIHIRFTELLENNIFVIMFQGDSGGPLVVYDNIGNPILIGVASFGSTRGCASGDPSDYARVTHFRYWIWTQTGLL
jgi:hypothetical protein